MRRPTRTTLRALRTGVILVRQGDASALPAVLRRLTSKEEGMATAEYAIGDLGGRGLRRPAAGAHALRAA